MLTFTNWTQKLLKFNEISFDLESKTAEKDDDSDNECENCLTLESKYIAIIADKNAQSADKDSQTADLKTKTAIVFIVWRRRKTKEHRKNIRLTNQDRANQQRMTEADPYLADKGEDERYDNKITDTIRFYLTQSTNVLIQSRKDFCK